jgi:hypothetical protein
VLKRKLLFSKTFIVQGFCKLKKGKNLNLFIELPFLNTLRESNITFWWSLKFFTKKKFLVKMKIKDAFLQRRKTVCFLDRYTDIQPTDKISFKQKMHFKLLYQRCQCKNKYQIQSWCIHKNCPQIFIFLQKKSLQEKF